MVISDEIYRTIVRHGYAGIDLHAFHQLIGVHIAGRHYAGWIPTSRQTTQLHIAKVASHGPEARYQSHGNIALKEARAHSHMNGNTE